MIYIFKNETNDLKISNNKINLQYLDNCVFEMLNIL